MSDWSRRRLLQGVGLGLVVTRSAWGQTGPTVPPAAIDNALEIEGETLAARVAQGRLTVSVLVNGRGPLRFAVDSGADRSVIGSSASKLLALPADESVILHSTTGTERVDTVRIERLTIGTSEIRNIRAPALPETYIGAQGLLGIDALADQRLVLDFQRKRIVVQDTRIAPASSSPDEIVVVARRRNGQLILTEASAGTVRIFAIVDSGAEVSVGNAALRARIFGARRPPAAGTVEIISVTGGIAHAESITLPQMKIGSITLQGVPLAFFEAPPFALFGLSQQPAILLGTDLLSAFSRVSLDFRARKVRFRLR